MSLTDAVLEEFLLPLTLEKQEVYIAIRADGVFGEGTKESPFNGSTPELLLRTLLLPQVAQPNVRIFFGPGIFRTWGGANDANLDIGIGKGRRGCHGGGIAAVKGRTARC